jgi:hypothetical protein
MSVAVNCHTFDALSRLSLDNANLFFCMGCCFVCHTTLHHVEQCSVKGHHILFCKCLDDPHRTCQVLCWWLSDLDFGFQDDNNCLGLVGTLAREEHNDAAAASWMVEALNDWGNTPSTSPVIKGWPDVWPEDHCNSFPCVSDVVPLCPDGWPDLLPRPLDGVQVTIGVVSSVEEVEGYSACRSLVSLGCLSVPDLLSFLYYSAVSTSLGSCIPCCRSH